MCAFSQRQFPCQFLHFSLQRIIALRSARMEDALRDWIGIRHALLALRPPPAKFGETITSFSVLRCDASQGASTQNKALA
jgi:hypothetical protein